MLWVPTYVHIIGALVWKEGLYAMYEVWQSYLHCWKALGKVLELFVGVSV